MVTGLGRLIHGLGIFGGVIFLIYVSQAIEGFDRKAHNNSVDIMMLGLEVDKIQNPEKWEKLENEIQS